MADQHDDNADLGDGFSPRYLNFEVFLRRLEAIKGSGFLEELAERSPGLAAILEHVDFDPNELESVEKILRAMTLEERLRPELLEDEQGQARRQRVAESAGTSIDEVDGLIAQFQTLRDLLSSRSPQDAIQELLDQTPQREAWETSAEAWKATGDPDFGPGAAETGEATAPEPAFPEVVDELLRKVGEVGMEGLSDDERVLLESASRYYQNRRQKSPR
jgi:hypothetical protein